ncbi:MAG TPA: DUF2938 domain-containing protein [Burkholderiales bacterium]
MGTLWQDFALVAFIGIGATAVMDAWLALLKRLGVKTQSFALIGRWAGHLLRGRLAHAAIGQAAPIRNELPLGWLIHYGVGIAFAGLLAAIAGPAWLRTPTLLPAVAVGFCTVVMPLFVMQPAMGGGIAGSKMPAPLKNSLRSMANHTVFGLGLYLSAFAISWIR